MGSPRFEFTVTVSPETPDVQLPVTIDADDVEMPGLAQRQVSFQVQNPLATAVEFTAVSVTKTGAGADLVAALLGSDAFVINAGGVHVGTLTLETQAPLPGPVSVQVMATGRAL